MIQIPWLTSDVSYFPPTSLALYEPNGLLAAGGDLSPERILAAYRRGIFPWFNPGEPILWWSPNPRTVIFPQDFHVSRSLRKILRQRIYTVTFDNCFTEVMRACAQPRKSGAGTWISENIIAGYQRLHEQGFTHSIEVWKNNELVGGLYGMAQGKVFFGESMFSFADNASKVGFSYLLCQLREWGFKLVDCQVANNHLFSLGAVEIPREEFEQYLLDFAHLPSVYTLPWSALHPDRWVE